MNALCCGGAPGANAGDEVQMGSNPIPAPSREPVVGTVTWSILIGTRQSARSG